MSTGSHVAIGLILSKALIIRGIFPAYLQTPLYLFGALAATAPDVDVILRKGKIYGHRVRSPFHYPLNWGLLALTMIFLAKAYEAQTVLPYLYLGGACILSHFLLDTIGVNDGICWLAPFSQKEYSFPRVKIKLSNFHDQAAYYLHHPIMYAEVLLCSIGIYLLLRK